MRFNIEKLPSMKTRLGGKESEKWVRGSYTSNTPHSDCWDLYCSNNASSRVNGNGGQLVPGENSERRMFSKSDIIVAKSEEGEVYGIAWAHPPRSIPPPKGEPLERGKKYLEQQFHVSVKAEAEGKGIGKLILNSIDTILEKDATPVCTWNPEYERAAHFFKKVGFNVANNKASKPRN